VPIRRKKNGSSSDGGKLTWDEVWRVGFGLLGYNRRELGVMTMRHLVNAFEGYTEKSREQWEQARMIAWYSAFDRKPFKLTDIQIPCEERSTKKASQHNKKEAYKLLDKWSK
jgi:hypothetical protein